MQIQYALVRSLAALLLHDQKKIVTAESCTGGLLASSFTDIPGSSQWFERGFVTYSNHSKMDLLGVSAEVLSQFGAVSCEVAYAMAKGALAASQADLSIAITGIAGPEGGTETKPVGTVCFGWGFQGKILTRQIHFPPTSRHRIRVLSCCEAIEGALRLMKAAS